MNFLVYIYILLYISYVSFGPHYIMRIIKKNNLDIAENVQEIGQRMFYLSYISYLYNAYYFYNPNVETFVNAIAMNCLSLIAFTVKWYDIRNEDPDYYSGILMHLIVVIPLFISLFYYKLSIPKKVGGLTIFTFIFIIIYSMVENKIYPGAPRNLKKLF